MNCVITTKLQIFSGFKTLCISGDSIFLSLESIVGNVVTQLSRKIYWKTQGGSGFLELGTKWLEYIHNLFTLFLWLKNTVLFVNSDIALLLTLLPILRFVLDKKFQRNTSKFANFRYTKTQSCFFHLSFRAILYMFT